MSRFGTDPDELARFDVVAAHERRLQRPVTLVVDDAMEDQAERSDGCGPAQVFGEHDLRLADKGVGLKATQSSLHRHHSSGRNMPRVNREHRVVFLSQDGVEVPQEGPAAEHGDESSRAKLVDSVAAVPVGRFDRNRTEKTDLVVETKRFGAEPRTSSELATAQQLSRRFAWHVSIFLPAPGARSSGSDSGRSSAHHGLTAAAPPHAASLSS